MKIESVRRRLGDFGFHDLFIHDLGWSQPTLRRPLAVEAQEQVFDARMIAQLAGAAVFQIARANDGAGVPERGIRDAVEREIAKHYRENLCIFVDCADRPTQSFWVWAKRGRDADGKHKRWLREHTYFRGQPADLFIGKLQALFFDLAEVADGANLTVVKVAQRMQEALDVERVTKQFYREYQAAHTEFLELIEGLDDERDRRWYASVLLNRLMFVWFLQKKGFLDHSSGKAHGDYDYLDRKLAASRARGKDRFHKEFLSALFFDAFAKPEAERSPGTRELCGKIPYLNGGLFLEHALELDEHRRLRIGTKLKVPDIAFENLFGLFRGYSWSLDDTPGGQSNEINPDVLGYIFERYINVVSTHSQKDLGAYYTRPEITSYLAERSIEAAVLQRIRKPALPELNLPAIDFPSVPELLARMDGDTAHELLTRVLPSLKILDPAVGSGAFLVAAMKVLINLYGAIVGKAQLGNDPALKAWLAREQSAHPNIGYAIRRRIITDNLYGVDLLEGAAEIAKLRLFLALVASAERLDDLEPLPNIDFNLLRGDSLIGLMRVDEHEFAGKQHGLFAQPFSKVLEQYNRDVANYKASGDGKLKGSDLRELRDGIETRLARAEGTLDDLLTDDFHGLNVRFEQATWDAARGDLGKPAKRAVEPDDIHSLHPFHWGLVFGAIMQGSAERQGGGFDVILTNPPWEVFKPQAKEFFADYFPELGKNKTQIEEFERDRTQLLGKRKDVREKYLAYESKFRHLNQYFRAAPEYRHQFASVDGRKVGSDLNLYKLFLERCFHLLRDGGRCGIVVPSSFYTDLGAKGLRELLFAHTRIEGLFGFENRKKIFDGVDSRFKFVVLTFEKQRAPRVQAAGECNTSAPPDDLLSPKQDMGTKSFPAAFMRLDVEELAKFPQQAAVEVPVELIRRLSPDSLSLVEFKSAVDVSIAEKMLLLPMLGDRIDGAWNLELRRELHMTDDSDLFQTAKCPRCLPLFEGRMIWQYSADAASPKYWIDERAGRQRLKAASDDQRLDYQAYRLAFREIASNTNERTVIAAVLPRCVFANHKLMLERGESLETGSNRLMLVAVFNSFCFDWLARMRVTTGVSMYVMFQMPVSRISSGSTMYGDLVRRAARLVCTTAQFDALAKEVGLGSHAAGATDVVERERLCAEIDGIVAHLYGMTEQEFVHVLSAFPLVRDPVKVAARNAYRDVAHGVLQAA